MTLETRHSIVHVAVIGLVITALAFVQCRSSESAAFEGTLHYPMVNIGGESSSAKLETADGVYDLFFESGPDRARLDRLAGKRIRVMGRPYRARGIERREYQAINVTGMIEF
jgi:hypothetical protein